MTLYKVLVTITAIIALLIALLAGDKITLIPNSTLHQSSDKQSILSAQPSGTSYYQLQITVDVRKCD
ncbi:hypothetical protein AJE_06161 [Alishewanella jeotgali KCTC 22429]|mgnify:CR=1 FL=1|uniref:Uncharacterized protein n=1 Tax=Alishewanella jeotgali KCTC 22429 TaxID=1129374 RepID=H3ZD09_9ALTE|nr:hypothetical protein AJE_06161 [Alishewanella jeotgali KCTC 22429]